MTKRRLVVIESDTHGGHKLGLCSPDAVIHEEDEFGNLVQRPVELGKFQQYLWKQRSAWIDQVREIAAADEIVLFKTGDMTHGVRHPEHLMSTRLADHIAIGVANDLPWLERANVRTVRYYKGTGWHVLGEGSSEILIAAQLQERYKQKSIQALYHGLADVDGVVFDLAHHGPFPGSRNWLVGNVARFYLRDLMMNDLAAGRVPPRVVVRGHYHTYVHEYLERETSTGAHCADLVIMPSLCGLGDYGHKSTRSTAYQTQGIMLFEIIDGDLGRIVPLKRALDVRTRETL